MYTIILISALFVGSNNQPASVASQQTFITKEACTNLATKMTDATGLRHECIKLEKPRSI